MNEFNDTRQKLLGDIDSLSDERSRVVRDMETSKAMAPAVFKRVGGEQVFADKMTSLDEQEAMLRSQQEDLDALYRRLGGEKVDALREQLIAETGGKTRATWKAEAIVTERALQRAQQEFVENYSAYQAMSETENSTDDPAVSPIEREAGIKAISNDVDGSRLADKALDNQETREELAPVGIAESVGVPDVDNSLSKVVREPLYRGEEPRHKDRELPTDEIYPNPHPKEVIGRPSQELTPPDAAGKELELYPTDKLMENMERVRDAYLEESAKMQKTHWYGVRENQAFMWLQGKFPKIADKIADVLSKPQDRLEELGRTYEAALKDVANRICHTDEERREYFIGQITEDAQHIVDLQQKKAPKPMSKWLRRAGYAAAGVAGGLAAFGGLGVALGAGIAGAGALAIRGRANKRNANTMVRNKEGKLRSAAGMNANMVVERFKNSYENPTETQFIGHLNEMTDKEVQKNRRRMLWPIIGAAGVALATKYGADWAYSWMTPDIPTVSEPSPSDTPDNTAPTPEVSTSPEPKPEPEPTPQEEFISGQEFVVEPGNSYTHELMDFASTNGKNLSPEQAFDLHNHLVGQFGADYIDIGGPSGDIYTDMGDYRLTQPGAARWADGVVEEAKRWMTGQGPW